MEVDDNRFVVETVDLANYNPVISQCIGKKVSLAIRVPLALLQMEVRVNNFLSYLALSQYRNPMKFSLNSLNSAEVTSCI